MSTDDRHLQDVAEAIADGASVDWDAAAARVGGSRASALTQLRKLAVASVVTVQRRPHEREVGLAVPRHVRWTAVAASLKLVVLGLLAILLSWPPPKSHAADLALVTADTAVFALVGWVLWYGGHRDVRARFLGTFFLVVADAFSLQPFLHLVEGRHDLVADAVRLLALISTDAVGGGALGQFVGAFPRLASFATPQRLVRVTTLVGWWVGVCLLTATVLHAAGLDAGLLAGFARGRHGVWYWLASYSLGFLLLALSIWKARLAPPDERRRFRLFVFALALGLLPLVATVPLAAVSPTFERFVTGDGHVLTLLVVHSSLLSVPLLSAYAVLVHRVLDVRLIVRRALQYILARYTLLLLTMLPFVGMAHYGWVHQDETLSAIASGRAAILLATLAGAGIALFTGRRSLLSLIDRWFFREERDTRQSVTRFADASRNARGVRELAALLRDEIERALHPTSIAITARQIGDEVFAPLVGWAPTLSIGSALTALLTDTAGPLPVDLESSRAVVQLLPAAERQWLADADTRLLVPLTAADRSIIGLIVLGDKKSDLPYSSEDRLFLSALAAASSIAIENRLLRSAGQDVLDHHGLDARAQDEPAAECERCHRILTRPAEPCACGGHAISAALPTVLLGKFQLEQRVGVGGMGVVYRALDLTLDRVVALKTLPRLSPEASSRLRREARAMASVVHPNLALVYGVETWRGLPVIIVEYLHGGTLRDRLRARPLAPRAAVALGVTLADALAHVHGMGVLHRDLKPSNIGFLADDTPKILDFGLARILDGSRDVVDEFAAHAEQQHRAREAQARVGTTLKSTAPDGTGVVVVSEHSRLVGTPLYLAPEAITRQQIGPSLDLWSLALLLYEAIAGANPFQAHGVRATLERVVMGQVPDIREYRPDCPSELARFFADALAHDLSDRPPSAAAFRASLEVFARRSADLPS